MEGAPKRFWEIDTLRGVAIVMMIIFHALATTAFFGSFGLSTYKGFWLYFARATAITFIFLVGISMNISFTNAKKKLNPAALAFKYIKRGLQIFGLGMIITLATLVFLREGFVIFGILHFIGLSVILAYPFLRLKYINLAAGILAIALGLYLKGFTFGFRWLLWFGFIPKGLYTVDYFPILPWFGIILIGLFVSKIAYRESNRKFSIPDIGNFTPIRALSFLGRHSLFIYMVHVPLLMALLYLLGVIDFF